MPTKQSEQVAKRRAKLQRVELLFRPEDFEALKAAAAAQNLTVSAYIKTAVTDYIERNAVNLKWGSE